MTAWRLEAFVALPPGITLQTADRIMSATARGQATIKQLHGVSPRGRPSKDPFYVLSLSWHPDERPTRPEVQRAVESALASVGLEGHQSFWVMHADTEHPHVHIVALRISWETGRTVAMSHDKKRLSAWALAYEKEQGEIRVETRVRRDSWRSEGRDLRQEQHIARGRGDTIAIRTLGREIAAHRRTFPPAEHSRGPGREARTDQDRTEWREVFACQRAQPDADPEVLRRERVRLSRKQGRRRRLKKVVAQAGDVVGRVSRVAGAGAVEIAHGASRTARVGAELAIFGAHEASLAARLGTKIALFAGLVTLAGTARAAGGGVQLVAKAVGALRPRERRPPDEPAVGFLADVKRALQRPVVISRTRAPARTGERAAATKGDGATDRPVPTAARAAAPAARSTPSPRPPPAPERPQTAMDFRRGLAVPKDTTRKGPSL